MKTDMVYIARGSFWLNLSHFVTLVSSLVLSIAFANMLSPESYGVYSTILSASSLLMIPVLMGMGTAVTRAVAQGMDGVLIEAIKTKLRWGVISVFMSLGICGYYLWQGNKILAFSFAVIAFFLPLMHTATLYDAYLVGKQRFKRSSQYQIIETLMHLVVLTVILFFSTNLFLILAASFGVHTGIRCFFLVQIVKQDRLAHPGLIKDSNAISFGKHLSLLGAFGTVSKYADRLLVWHFLGPVQVAIYSFATLPITHISEFFQPLSTLAFSKFSQSSGDLLKKTIPKKMLIIFLFSIPIILVYILIAPFVYQWFFPQYIESIFFSQLFSLTLLLQGNRLFAPFFNSQSKIGVVYLMNFVIPAVKLVSMFVLLPFYGILGMIFAQLGSLVFNLCFQMYLLKKH